MVDNAVLIERAQAGEKEARKVLIEQNLGLVHHIVKRFTGRGIEAEDLFQIGTIGLLKAIDKTFHYMQSTQKKKLNALSSLSSSINLFRNLIDRNFNNKRIIFNKDYGFRFITTYSDSTILPQSLSSGEQHELVMFYDLIFNASENTLI